MTPIDQPRVAPECPNPHVIYYTTVETTDWWQIAGGTVTYLGSTTETVTEIVELCTPGGFDQYYTDYTGNTQFLSAIQARAQLFDRIYDHLMDEDALLLNPCEPGNSSVDNIQDVLDELEIFSLVAFYEAYNSIIQECFEDLENEEIINDLCLEATDLVSLSDPDVTAYYVKFLDLQINFIHTGTGQNFQTNFSELCIQVPDRYPRVHSVEKIQRAFRLARYTTEATLNSGFIQPLSNEVKIAFLFTFRSLLAGEFSNPNSSTITGPGGCRGDIPGIPGDWTC